MTIWAGANHLEKARPWFASAPLETKDVCDPPIPGNSHIQGGQELGPIHLCQQGQEEADAVSLVIVAFLDGPRGPAGFRKSRHSE